MATCLRVEHRIGVAEVCGGLCSGVVDSALNHHLLPTFQYSESTLDCTCVTGLSDIYRSRIHIPWSHRQSGPLFLREI